MSLPSITFDVGRNDLSISIMELVDVKIQPSSDGWDVFEQDKFQQIRDSITLSEVKDDSILRSYRDMYWTYGMDPTKLRVSSEALLRRILKGLNLWRISNIVDVVNLASPSHRLPIGLIDAERVMGSLQVRIAERGEIFTRIGGKKLECRGREIVLADEEKIVCFGYATHDSEQTKVTANTEQIYLLHYGAPIVQPDYLDSAVDETTKMVKKWVPCVPNGVQYYFS